MPILAVLAGKFKTVSTLSKISHAKATSSGPCIFGLTIYIELVLEFPFTLKSYIAPNTVIKASNIPSGISLLSLSKIAGFVIK